MNERCPISAIGSGRGSRWSKKHKKSMEQCDSSEDDCQCLACVESFEESKSGKDCKDTLHWLHVMVSRAVCWCSLSADWLQMWFMFKWYWLIIS